MTNTTSFTAGDVDDVITTALALRDHGHSLQWVGDLTCSTSATDAEVRAAAVAAGARGVRVTRPDLAVGDLVVITGNHSDHDHPELHVGVVGTLLEVDLDEPELPYCVRIPETGYAGGQWTDTIWWCASVAPARDDLGAAVEGAALPC